MDDFDTYRVSLTAEEAKIVRDGLKATVASFEFDSIGYVGLLGGVHEGRAAHDVDVVMFTGGDRKIGESLIENFQFYNRLEQRMKDEHPRYHLSIFPKKVKQELTNYINTVQRGQKAMIPVHNLFFPDKASMHATSPATFCESVQSEARTLHGSYEVIPEQQELSLDQQEPYFRLIEYAVLSIHGRFPEKLIKAKMEGVFDYLSKYHGVSIPDADIHTQEAVLKTSKNLLRQLDERYYD